MIPLEIWRKIFTFVDLDNQRNVSMVSRDFCILIESIWRSLLLKLQSEICNFTDDFSLLRHNLVMKALFEQYPVEKCPKVKLFSIVKLHLKLKEPDKKKQEHIKDHNHNQDYTFYHDYHIPNRKYLDLYQKWPRPGKKSLEKFYKGNLVNVIT